MISISIRQERARGVMEDVIAGCVQDIKGPTLVGKESFRLSYVAAIPRSLKK